MTGTNTDLRASQGSALLAMGVVLTLLLSACGSSSDDEGQSVTVETPMGTVSGQTNPDGGVSLPPDFPEDVAIFPELSIISAVATPSGHMVVGHSTAQRQRIADFYLSEMTAKGWQSMSPGMASPTMNALSFKKEGRGASINVVDRKDGKTMVQMTLMPTH